MAQTLAALDVEKIRADFPILHRKVRDQTLVYLDSAATAQKPAAVIDAIDHYYRHSNANVHRALHTLSEEATAAYEGAREKVRDFLNAAHSHEIIYTRGTTEAINLVAQSYGRKVLGPGDEVLITWMEHHSNIVPWQMVCEQTGATLKVLPMTDSGEWDMARLPEFIGSNTKIVAVSHVSNALGTVNPLSDMIDHARMVGAVIVVDGAQAVPHMAVDVQALDVDFYAFSSHKLFGPTGFGILYGKTELLNAMPPYQGGGDMIKTVSFDGTIYNDLPHKFEAGTPHIAGAVGLGAAIDYIQAIGMDRIAAYEAELLEYGTRRLEAEPGVKLVGTAKHKAAVFSFVVDQTHPHDVGAILSRQGLAVRTGHHCAQPIMDRFQIPATTRASLAFYNTTQEIDALCEGLAKVRKVFGIS